MMFGSMIEMMSIGTYTKWQEINIFRNATESKLNMKSIFMPLLPLISRTIPRDGGL